MHRIALLALTIALLACPGGLYEPCQAVEDCDPLVADACALGPAGAGEGWCTVVCTVDTDCPAGPEGELAECILVGKAKVCKLNEAGA